MRNSYMFTTEQEAKDCIARLNGAWFPAVGYKAGVLNPTAQQTTKWMGSPTKLRDGEWLVTRISNEAQNDFKIPQLDMDDIVTDFDDISLNLTGSNATVSPLTVVGNKIKVNDSDFHIKGVSLPEAGSNFASYPGIEYCERGLGQFTGMNAVRVPCQPTYMEGIYGVQLYIEKYVDPIVKWCEENSVYCIIDYHAIEDWNTATIDTRIKAFWDIAASGYKDLPHVLFEIFNEPVKPTNGSSTWTDFKPTVQGWVDYVRAIAPDNIILVPTPNYDQYVNQASLSPLTGSNLVYVEHMYPGHMPGGSRVDWNGDAVSDETLATKTTWMQGNFGDANDRVPVFVSEWGYDLSDGGFYLLKAKTRESFGEPLVDYMNTNKVHWTSWNFSHLSAPKMITNEDDFALTDFGSLVKDSL